MIIIISPGIQVLVHGSSSVKLLNFTLPSPKPESHSFFPIENQEYLNKKALNLHTTHTAGVSTWQWKLSNELMNSVYLITWKTYHLISSEKQWKSNFGTKNA